MKYYNISEQGTSHKESEIVCQDYSKSERLNNNWYFGAIADGVGSAIYSNIGSQNAVEAAFDFFKTRITENDSYEEIISLLKLCYRYSLDTVFKVSQKMEKPISEFDTTLDVVLYNGEKLLWGHSGDGGIIGEKNDGTFYSITSRQKGSDSVSVIPLRGGEETWEFGMEENIASVLMVTDGMLDGLFIPVLLNIPLNKKELDNNSFKKNNVYVSAAIFFMNPYSSYKCAEANYSDNLIKQFVKNGTNVNDQKLFLACLKNAYNNIFKPEIADKIIQECDKYYNFISGLNEITDDKTVLCIMNDNKRIISDNINYYREPDWEWRTNLYNALLYNRDIPEIVAGNPVYDEKNGICWRVEKEDNYLKSDNVKREDNTSYFQNSKYPLNSDYNKKLENRIKELENKNNSLIMENNIINNTNNENISKQKRLNKKNIGMIIINVILTIVLAVFTVISLSKSLSRNDNSKYDEIKEIVGVNTNEVKEIKDILDLKLSKQELEEINYKISRINGRIRKLENDKSEVHNKNVNTSNVATRGGVSNNRE